MKYKLDIVSAEGITTDVLKQHHKWAQKRIKKAQKAMDKGEYYHPEDIGHDMRLESNIRQVLDYFGEKV